eukprot:5983389-Amphidinium_carterae.1
MIRQRSQTCAHAKESPPSRERGMMGTHESSMQQLPCPLINVLHAASDHDGNADLSRARYAGRLAAQVMSSSKHLHRTEMLNQMS